MQAALQVQQTGSAYIAALAALAAIADSEDVDAVRQGREAARAALRAAATEFASLAPEDPVASRLVWLLADRTAASPDALDATRNVLWF